ncbi:hypothetical protein [Bradyrhizobium sp. 41S5]|nr:hypothetical protein [Bradyrhizobium sp. 41S5]
MKTGCKSGSGASTYRRTMWRMSTSQALIFIAAVIVAVTVLLLA